MRRSVPIFFMVTMLLTGCGGGGQAALTPRQEQERKVELVRENRTRLSAGQMSLFLRTRFKTEQRMQEALKQLLSAGGIHDRAAARKTASVLWAAGAEAAQRTALPPLEK